MKRPFSVRRSMPNTSEKSTLIFRITLTPFVCIHQKSLTKPITNNKANEQASERAYQTTWYFALVVCRTNFWQWNTLIWYHIFSSLLFCVIARVWHHSRSHQNSFCSFFAGAIVNRIDIHITLMPFALINYVFCIIRFRIN